MADRGTQIRCVVAVALVCWSLIAPSVVADGVAAQETAPETADEYLDALRELEGQAAFDEYSEFEVVRAQAVSAVQVGEFTDEKATRIALVYETLVTFDEAYERGQRGERVESLDRARETGELLDDLREADGSQYAALISIALDRFYQNQGETLHEEALATDDTRTKLALMETAATAYKRGSAVEEYSNLVVQRERLQSTYESDVETLNESMAVANEFSSQCGEACDSPVEALSTHSTDVFDYYADAREADARLGLAADVAAKHGLSDRAENVEAVRESTRSSVVSLALASVVLALGVALAIALVAMLVAYRLAAWARDVEDSQVGDIVLAEEVIHG